MELKKEVWKKSPSQPIAAGAGPGWGTNTPVARLLGSRDVAADFFGSGRAAGGPSAGAKGDARIEG